MDREYAANTFVVMTMELSREASGFTVASVAALGVRGDGWQPQWRVHARVGTAPEAASGADAQIVWASSAGSALAAVEQKITTAPHVAVTRLGGGSVEAAMVRAERASCPRLASLTMWDALRLAQISCPAVTEPSESTLAAALRVPYPKRGAPVTQMVWALSQMCRTSIEQGVIAGRCSGPVQERLFDE